MNILKIIFFFTIGIIVLSCNRNERRPKIKSEIQSDAKLFTVGKELPIWTKSIPDSELITGTESYKDGMVKNVSNPTINLLSNKPKATPSKKK